MTTYLYAKWKSAPADSPVEFYSELDDARWEKRKVEVFPDGHMGYASAARSSNDGTRLAIVALPSLDEISRQIEFDAKLISAEDFEAVWMRATT
jgi:hypothetical protein